VSLLLLPALLPIFLYLFYVELVLFTELLPTFGLLVREGEKLTQILLQQFQVVGILGFLV
jgi:hypothetical protein